MRIKGNIYTENFNFEYGEIVFDDGVITDINFISEKALDSKEKRQYIIPGLVDIHMHGAVGVDVCGADNDGLNKIAEYEKSCGVSYFCPTTMTLPVEELLKIVKIIKETSHEQKAIVGINLEGPYISEKKCGAQGTDNIPQITENILNDYERLLIETNEFIKLSTVAPERNGVVETIKKFCDKIHFSVGHSEATYEESMKAFLAGADHVTHLYNGMSYVNHREPGIVGAAFDNKNVFVELICDGNHVHPSVIRSAFDSYGEERIILISDSTEATGCEDGEYLLGEVPIIKKGNKAVLKSDKSTLAGSVTNLYQMMKIAIKDFGIPIEKVVRTVTYNPAKSIGEAERMGSLKCGRRADIVVLDDKIDIVQIFHSNDINIC